MAGPSNCESEVLSCGTPDAALWRRPPTVRPALRRRCRFAVTACIAIALVHNVASTWQHWGDLVIDSGRELDTPKQLLAGKTLYADVRYWYGPLAPYTNALLFRVFGVRVGVLTTAGIVAAALLAWLSYRLVRLFAPRVVAAAAAVAFLYINAFGQYGEYNIFSFPLPYTCSATYGMVLAAAGIYFLLRHIRRGRASDLLLSCLFLALTALCKLEVLFAALAAHLIFLAGWIVGRRLDRLVYLLGYAGAIALPAGVYMYFRARAGAALWHDNLFLPGNLATGRFNLEQAGLWDLAESLRYFGISAAGLLVCLAAMWLTARAERRSRERGNRASIAAIGAAGMLVCGGTCYMLGPFIAFRSLPVLLLACFVFFAARSLADPSNRAANVSAMVLYAFALAALPRSILRCSADLYGFYLMVPALLGSAVLWCRFLPAVLAVPRPARRDHRADSTSSPADAPAGRTPCAGHKPPAIVVACGVAMLLALAWTHRSTTRRTMHDYFVMDEASLVRTPQGTLPCLFQYRDTVDAAVRLLQEKPSYATVVAFPEGAAIGFLAGCTNPYGMHSFLPLDFSGACDEPGLLRRLASAPPDFILVLSRSMPEHGSRGFGVDYGQPILEWTKAHYAVVERFRSILYEVTVFGKPQP